MMKQLISKCLAATLTLLGFSSLAINPARGQEDLTDTTGTVEANSSQSYIKHENERIDQLREAFDLSFVSKSYWCVDTGTKYQTRGRYPSGSLVVVEWVSPLDGLSAKQRCEVGSANMHSNLIEKGAIHLFIGRDHNGRKAICASEQLTSDAETCEKSTIIVSLSDEDNIDRVLYRFVEMIGSTNPKPIQVFRVISPGEVAGKTPGIVVPAWMK